MSERVQEKNEILANYFYNKVKLCCDLNLSFPEIKEQVLVWLWSHDLCSTMAARSHINIEDLLHDMLAYERLNDQRRERIKASKENSKVNIDKKLSTHPFLYTPKTESNTSLYNSSRTIIGNNPDKRSPLRNIEGQLKCYNCPLFGHISKNCPEPSKSETCNKCGGKGHTQRQY